MTETAIEATSVAPEALALPPVTLADLETACRDYAHARTDLQTWHNAQDAAVAKIKEQYRPALIAGLAQHNTLREALVALLKRAPSALFVKPRTHQFHGLRVGYEMGKGRLQFDASDEDVIKRIKELFPLQEKALIDVIEKPAADRLKKMATDDLAKLGGKIVGKVDQMVLRSVDSDLDRIIAALSGDIARTGVAEEVMP